MMMLTRRELLAAAGGTVVGVMSQTAVRTGFDVPPGACDCHVHVFGDPARFPFADSRTYTPATATVDELRALIAANRDRILWGSDWPHPDTSTVSGRKPTDIAAPLPIDDARVFQQLSVWAPETTVRHRILVDNPARLYGF